MTKMVTEIMSIEILILAIAMKDKDTKKDQEITKDLMKEPLSIDTFMTGIKIKDFSMNDNMTEVMKDNLLKDQAMKDPHMTGNLMRGHIRTILIRIKVLLIGITKIVKTNIKDLIKIKSTIKIQKTFIELNFSWK